MAAFARKVLWIVSLTKSTETRLAAHAKACGVDAVCVRTDNTILPDAIKRFKALGLKTYGWRWPAVTPKPNSRTHYFASDEAAFVVEKLIPAGLAGYIVDPESERGSPGNDWNDKKLASLAHSFCGTIRDGAKHAGTKDFVFGVTSGCDYPTSRRDMPWAEFVAASDCLFPQTYWRWTNAKGKVQDINFGDPVKAAAKGLASWRHIAGKLPIVPMAGEIDVVTPAELAVYASEVKRLGLDQFHFYTDGAGVTKARCDAIAAI